MFVVELEKKVWIAPWKGDPGRTLKIENAKQYKRLNHAKHGLKMARKYRPFLKAKVRRIVIKPNVASEPKCKRKPRLRSVFSTKKLIL